MSTHHDTLAVPFDATPEEIKTAFREAALRWHPDHNPDGATAPLFRAAEEARGVLLDPHARASYEQSLGAGPNVAAVWAKLEDLAMGGDTAVIEETTCAACRGVGTLVQVCTACAGFGLIAQNKAGLKSHGRCRPCAGVGDTGAAACAACSGAGKTQQVVGKARVRPGHVEGNFCWVPGVGVRALRSWPHAVFRRDGADVSLSASLGDVVEGRLRLTTPGGRTVDVNVPGEADKAAPLRVKGLGLPCAGGAGDLFVVWT